MTTVKETLDATLVESDTGDRRINQYTIVQELGSGAFGTVHLAVDRDTNTQVALKEFSKSKLRRQKAMKSSSFCGAMRRRGKNTSPGLPTPSDTTTTASSVSTVEGSSSNPIDLVKTEIAILKKLNHPNVVKLFEVLDDPSQDSMFMVFELCKNGTIMHLDDNPQSLPLFVARSYFQQLLLGIEYLHEHDIVHRDIKPDNMLLSSDNVLKIVDFGVSEIFTNEQAIVKKSAGSPAFYAPEMCSSSHGDLQAKAVDVWAMGVTLFCMVVGNLPFQASSSILELYHDIQTKEPDYPQTLDPSLTDLLRKMLDKDPIKRITIEQIRLHPWVTDNGTKSLLSKEANCKNAVVEVTQQDLETAIKPAIKIFTVLKAVSKLKKLRSNVSHNALNKLNAQE